MKRNRIKTQERDMKFLTRIMGRTIRGKSRR
jgi:hypothetical protein